MEKAGNISVHFLMREAWLLGFVGGQRLSLKLC